MSAISDLLNKLKSAIYGREVRQTIHDAIEQCYKDATGAPESVAAVIAGQNAIEGRQDSLDARQDTLDARIDNFLSAHGGTISETVLWTGTAGKPGDTITLSSPIEEFDYIDIYYHYNGRAGIYTATPEDLRDLTYGAYLREVNQINPSGIASSASGSGIGQEASGGSSIAGSDSTTSTSSSGSTNLSSSEIYIQSAGLNANEQTTTLTIAHAVQWVWDGASGDDAQQIILSSESTTYSAGYVYKIVGRRLVDNAEVLDLRVDADGTTHATAGEAIRGQISALKEDLAELEDEIASGTGDGLTADVKQALMDVAEHIGAWTDGNAQTYTSALRTALYPPASLKSISAAYTQSGTVYDNASLDSLKSDLVVTAKYSDGTSQIVTNYSLSGTLATGTSTITVAYGGKTTTFNVTVTHATTQYSITNNLTDVVNSNKATAINENTAYSATLSPSTGYRISNVSITMGGTNITSTAYADGVITIDSVTGDIVITATAVEDVPVSDGTAWYDGVNYAFQEGITEDYYINSANGQLTSYTTWAASDYMCCLGASTLEAYGVNSSYGAFYDTNKTYISACGLGSSANQGYKKTVDIPSNAAYFRTSWALPHASSPAKLLDDAYITPHA